MSEEEEGVRRPRTPKPRRRSAGADGEEAVDDRDPRLPVRKSGRRRRDSDRRRLFTATAALAFDRSVMLVFHASVARSAREVRLVLRQRFGEVGAGLARISEGYDERNFIARTIVAPTLRDLLRDIEEDPYGVAADGFDVTHMQTVGTEPAF